MVQANNNNNPKVRCTGDAPGEEGVKMWEVVGSRFKLPVRYEIVDPLGSGAYGVVVAAKDTTVEDEQSPEAVVAIKKIEKAFEHKVFTLRTLRELKIQRLL